MKKTIVSLMVFAGLGLGSGSVLAVYVPYGDAVDAKKTHTNARGYVPYEDTSTATKHTQSSHGYVPFYDDNATQKADTSSNYPWHRSSTYCPTTAFFARGDGYYASLGLRIPASLRSIQKYRVRWSDGQWSQRFIPGDDVDMSTGLPARGRQRMWAYFDVYDYEVTRCGNVGSGTYWKRYVVPHYKSQVASSARNVIYPSFVPKISTR